MLMVCFNLASCAFVQKWRKYSFRTWGYFSYGTTITLFIQNISFVLLIDCFTTELAFIGDKYFNFCESFQYFTLLQKTLKEFCNILLSTISEIWLESSNKAFQWPGWFNRWMRTSIYHPVSRCVAPGQSHLLLTIIIVNFVNYQLSLQIHCKAQLTYHPPAANLVLLTRCDWRLTQADDIQREIGIKRGFSSWYWHPMLQLVLCNRLIGEVVQSRRRPLLGPSPSWKHRWLA